MIDKVKAAAMAWTIETVELTKLEMILSEVSIEDPTATVPNYISNTLLILMGVPTPPYILSTIQIRFVPDSQKLMTPSYQPPVVVCEKHQSEYAGIMDMISRGIENKKPGVSFTALFIVEIPQLDLILVG